MRRFGFILIVLLSGIARAQSSSTADVYRIAATEVPTPANDAQRFVMEHALDAPLDAAATELLKKGEKSLQLFDAASLLFLETWGLDESDPTYGGRTIRELPQLADLVILRARQNAAQSKVDLALEDCAKLALLSRRLSFQPSLSRQAQQNVIMEKALGMAATLLPSMSADQIEHFGDSLHELPPPANVIDVAGTEQETYLWLYGKLIENNEVRQLTSGATGAINLVFGIQTQPIKVDDLARDPQRAQEVLNQTREVFTKMIDALKQPPDERAAAMKIIPSSFDFSHDLSRNAAQIVLRLYRQNERHEALMDMYQCAAAIYSEPTRPIDPARARAVAGRFECIPVQGGFELRWRAEEQELVLHAAARAFEATPSTRGS